MGHIGVEACAVDNFTKAVISFWFRIPLETAQAARDKSTGSIPGVTNPTDLTGSGIGIWDGVVPLFTFGKQQTTTFYNKISVPGEAYTVSTYFYPGGDGGFPTDGPWTLGAPGSGTTTQEVIDAAPVWDLPPSYIGIECTPARTDGGYPNRDLYTLKIHLQMNSSNTSTKQGLYYYLSNTSYGGSFTIYSTSGFSSFSPSGPPSTHTGAWGTYVVGTDEHVVVEGRSQPSPGIYFADFWPPLSTVTYTITLTDVSDPDHTIPEVFELGGSRAIKGWGASLPGGAPIPYPKLEIIPDKWHHAIVSFDLSNVIVSHGLTTGEWLDAGSVISAKANISSAAKAWIALDDVDINGHDLSQFCRCGQFEDPDDPNDIVTAYAMAIAQMVAPALSASFLSVGYYSTTEQPGSVKPQFSFTADGLPINLEAVGIPADPRYVSNILKVETAEFQMFTGVTMDTSVTNNRRVFIDFNEKTGALTPHKKYQDAVDLLGVEPVIAFRKSAANWKHGKNQGTTADWDVIVGDIKTYRPNPKI